MLQGSAFCTYLGSWLGRRWPLEAGEGGLSVDWQVHLGLTWAWPGFPCFNTLRLVGSDPVCQALCSGTTLAWPSLGRPPPASPESALRGREARTPRSDLDTGVGPQPGPFGPTCPSLCGKQAIRRAVTCWVGSVLGVPRTALA